MKLSTVWDIQEEIKDVKQRIDSLRLMMETVTPLLDGLPKAKPITPRIEKGTTEILDCERRLDRLVEDLARAKVDLTLELADQFTDNLLTVMVLREVNCMSYRKIADAMYYSFRHVYRLHKRGHSLFKDKDA